MKRLLTVPLIAALTAAAIAPCKVSAAELNIPDAVSAERVAYLVNKYRRANRLNELKVLPSLNESAMVRVNELTSNFDHHRPDGSLFSSAVTISYKSLGENSAYGQPTPEAALAAWMKSEGHRKNILSPNYEYIGVGVCCRNGVYYWDQVFAGTRGETFSDAYPPSNYGDVTGDSILDAVDASAVLTEYARTSVGNPSSFNSTQNFLADITRNGTVDAIDATCILTSYARSSAY